MTITAKDRKVVRERAQFACEYCGVRESDAGGQLTIDHYQPKTKGGDDSLNNLLYCCIRCNQYKADYWTTKGRPSLWNPRHENALQHFVELDDGTLAPLTTRGVFTLHRLRLNRQSLIAWRQEKHQRADQTELVNHYREVIDVITRLAIQQSNLIHDQHQVLQQQQELLQQFVRDKGTPD